MLLYHAIFPFLSLSFSIVKMKMPTWSLICISAVILQQLQFASAQVYNSSSSSLSLLNAAIGEELDNTALDAPIFSTSDDTVSESCISFLYNAPSLIHLSLSLAHMYSYETI